MTIGSFDLALTDNNYTVPRIEWVTRFFCFFGILSPWILLAVQFIPFWWLLSMAAQLCLRATTLYFGSQVKQGFELLYLKGGLEMIDSLW